MVSPAPIPSSNQPVALAGTTVYAGRFADERLALLGLTRQEIIDCVVEGEHARDSTTAHHPVNVGGVYAYGERTRAFRDTVVPRGWTIENPNNVALTIAPDGLFAIGTQIGTDGTGREHGKPTNKYRKGSTMVKVVDVNNQLSLLPAEVVQVVPAGARDVVLERRTYFILVSRKADYVWVEMSLPDGVDESGRANHYCERIVIGSVHLGPSVDAGGHESGPEDDYNVEIKRRS